MRRSFGHWILCLAVAAAFCLTPACKRKRSLTVDLIDEGAGQLSSVVHTADPKTAVQLTKGFHAVEQNSWRWTKGHFSVALQSPPTAAVKGGVLTMKFAIPELVVERLKSIEISAVLNGRALPTHKFDKPGEHEYSVKVPPEAFSSEVVSVDFSLSKFLAAGEVDLRELGLVVKTIAIEPQ